MRSELDPAADPRFAIGVPCDFAVEPTTDGRLALIGRLTGEWAGHPDNFLVMPLDEARRIGRELVEGADRLEGRQP